MSKKIFIFLIIGFLIYLLDIALNLSKAEKDIYIADDEIKSLIAVWKDQVGRNPNDDELVRIINNLIEEEILYREALKLGLDVDDKIIKRRLAQKVTFLKESYVDKNPSLDDLLEFYKINKSKYFIDSKYSFQHYFFRYDEDNKQKILDELENLSLDEISKKHEQFFLGDKFIEITSSDIMLTFGKKFLDSIKINLINTWQGPYDSPHGIHLVYLKSYIPGYFPDFNNIKNIIENDFINENKNKAIQDFINNKKDEYKIIINPDLKFDDI